MVKDFNIPTIYVIPKVHKSLSKQPRRPLTSANGGPLEQIGQFLDALICGMVKELPFFVQDTRNVLQKIVGVEVPEGSMLASIDVESLYTSMTDKCVISAVAHFLDEKYPTMGSQKEFILNLLNFALTHNCFQFAGLYYHQLRGTSLGPPAYACLHLGR